MIPIRTSRAIKHSADLYFHESSPSKESIRFKTAVEMLGVLSIAGTFYVMIASYLYV
jgi:hypothetical protein